MKEIKKFWKQILAAVVMLVVVAVGIRFAFADEIGIVIQTADVHEGLWEVGMTDTVSATVTGVAPDETTGEIPGTITWTTSNAEVVALTDNGDATATVYAVGAGRAELIATYTNGEYVKTKSLIVSVTLKRVDTQYQTLEVGSGTSLSTNYSNANQVGLTWVSSDENIVNL